MASIKFARLVQQLAKPSFYSKSSHASISSTSGLLSDNSILTRSTILLQDGSDITEQPLVIKRIRAEEFPFAAPVSYVHSKSLDSSMSSSKLADDLRSCVTIAQVLYLLEIPGESVSGDTAAQALIRIHQLQANQQQLSFIRQAVLHELCDTVVKELSLLQPTTLISLLNSVLNSKEYNENFLTFLYEEVETRIGDAVFTIKQICTLIEMLSVNTKSSQSVINNLWIHLGNRYKDVEGECISNVYETLRYISPEYKYLFHVFDKSVKRCWWKLQANDVSSILRMMTLSNHYSASTLITFGRWLQVNIHDVTDNQLKEIIAAYNQFKFSDPQVVKAIERYVLAKIKRMDHILTGMVMDFFRSRRLLSPCVFDAVALNFENRGHEYEARELLKVLRVYGQLNYLPHNVTNFFSTVEDVLMNKFSDFDAGSLLELMASFVYVERFPINFLRKIFTPHFLAKCLAIPNRDYQQQTGRHLLELQAAINIEYPQHASSKVDRDSLGLSLAGLGPRYVKFHHEVRSVLMELFGPDRINQVEIPHNTPHLIDFEICLGSRNTPLVSGSSGTKSRLALIGLLPEYYCVNTNHLLGEHAMRKRHLEKLGYTVVELQFEEFMWKHKHGNSKKNYILKILSPYLEFR